MNDKNYAEVLIDGKIYTLGGAEDQEYLQKVAGYITGKMNELKKQDRFLRQSQEYQAVMVALNIADDYFKAMAKVAKSNRNCEEMEKETYSLKHELVTTQISLEQRERELESAKRETEQARQELERAEQAKQELESAKREAEQARQELETAKREAEQARQDLERAEQAKRELETAKREAEQAKLDLERAEQAKQELEQAKLESGQANREFPQAASERTQREPVQAAQGWTSQESALRQRQEFVQTKQETTRGNGTGVPMEPEEITQLEASQRELAAVRAELEELRAKEQADREELLKLRALRATSSQNQKDGFRNLNHNRR